MLIISFLRDTRVNRIHQQHRVFDSSFYDRPKLLDEQTEAGTLLLRLLDLLVEKLFAVLQKLHQLLVLGLQLLNLLDVSSLLVNLFINDLLLFKQLLLEDTHVLSRSRRGPTGLMSRAAPRSSTFRHVEG